MRAARICSMSSGSQHSVLRLQCPDRARDDCQCEYSDSVIQLSIWDWGPPVRLFSIGGGL